MEILEASVGPQPVIKLVSHLICSTIEGGVTFASWFWFRCVLRGSGRRSLPLGSEAKRKRPREW